MRDIKFRALDENDKWIYGMPLTNVEHEEKEFPIMRNCDETGYWGIKNIDPKTLGQYTGLKDRNGVEIYEHSELDGAYEVIFKDMRYSLRHIRDNDIIDLHDYWRGKNGEIEVTREYTKV